MVGLPLRSPSIPERPSLNVVRTGAIVTVVGASAVSVLGAIAYLQARVAVTDQQHPIPPLDGHFGVSEDHVLCRVVWLGDSLAAGLGAISPELSLPRLVAMGRDQHTRLHVFAEPGATSAHVVANQLPAMEQLRHGLGQIGQVIDAVGVTVGANDIAALTPRHRFRRNVRQIVEAAEGVPVVLVSIPHLSHAIGVPHPLRAFASWRASWLDLTLRAAAHRPDVHYASVRRRPVWIRRRDLRNFLAADRFHPSGAGYAVWAGLVTEAFDAALAPTPIAEQSPR